MQMPVKQGWTTTQSTLQARGQSGSLVVLPSSVGQRAGEDSIAAAPEDQENKDDQGHACAFSAATRLRAAQSTRGAHDLVVAFTGRLPSRTSLTSLAR